MHSFKIAESAINWNGGQVITLNAGQTATCTTLRPGQIYGIIIYNSAQHDNNAQVNVVWSQSQPPVALTVPGTTANAGDASMCFISGDDTQTISISLNSGSGIEQVTAYLGSVSMPTDTSGLSNQALPGNGNPENFGRFDRYYAVPASSWYSLKITSTLQQFICCQFRQAEATVYVINETSNGLLTGQVTSAGPTAEKQGSVIINAVQSQSITTNLQGDGTQWVWMNASSGQNSKDATIALQSLTI